MPWARMQWAKTLEEKMRRQGNGRPLLRLSGLALSGEPGLLQPLPGYAARSTSVLTES
jgi:hypothetical protein